MKKFILMITMALSLAACEDAEIASRNLSKASDNFEVVRRIVFMNGITDKYILEIEGFCSISHYPTQLEVICKTGKGKYKKHFLGLSDNVTYFLEQKESHNVSKSHYKVTFKPSVIIPDIRVR